MSSNGPAWLDAVRRLERAIGVPAERFFTSDTYFDLLPHVRRAQAQAEELVVRMTEDWYRLFNVPTGSEVREIRAQLGRIERRLDKLTKQLADRDD